MRKEVFADNGFKLNENTVLFAILANKVKRGIEADGIVTIKYEEFENKRMDFWNRGAKNTYYNFDFDQLNKFLCQKVNKSFKGSVEYIPEENAWKIDINKITGDLKDLKDNELEVVGYDPYYARIYLLFRNLEIDTRIISDSNEINDVLNCRFMADRMIHSGYTPLEIFLSKYKWIRNAVTDSFQLMGPYIGVNTESFSERYTMVPANPKKSKRLYYHNIENNILNIFIYDYDSNNVLPLKNAYSISIDLNNRNFSYHIFERENDSLFGIKHLEKSGILPEDLFDSQNKDGLNSIINKKQKINSKLIEAIKNKVDGDYPTREVTGNNSFFAVNPDEFKDPKYFLIINEPQLYKEYYGNKKTIEELIEIASSFEDQKEKERTISSLRLLEYKNNRKELIEHSKKRKSVLRFISEIPYDNINRNLIIEMKDTMKMVGEYVGLNMNRFEDSYCMGSTDHLDLSVYCYNRDGEYFNGIIYTVNPKQDNYFPLLEAHTIKYNLLTGSFELHSFEKESMYPGIKITHTKQEGTILDNHDSLSSRIISSNYNCEDITHNVFASLIKACNKEATVKEQVNDDYCIWGLNPNVMFGDPKEALKRQYPKLYKEIENVSYEEAIDIISSHQEDFGDYQEFLRVLYKLALIEYERKHILTLQGKGKRKSLT